MDEITTALQRTYSQTVFAIQKVGRSTWHGVVDSSLTDVRRQQWIHVSSRWSCLIWTNMKFGFLTCLNKYIYIHIHEHNLVYHRLYVNRKRQYSIRNRDKKVVLTKILTGAIILNNGLYVAV